MTRALRILCLVVSLVAIPAADAVAASCERENTPIFDGGGYIYDFTATAGYGQPALGGSNGPGDIPSGPVETTNAWGFWGNVLVFPPGADLTSPVSTNRYSGDQNGCAFPLGGQEIVYPVAPMHGLEVQHRWYVDPGPLNGARILTVLRNPGAAPVSATLVVGDPSGFDRLGSGAETRARATSNGTGVFSPASYWGVSTDEGGGQDPALAHVWGAPGGAIAPSEVVLGNAFLKEILYWAWNITVPPSQTFAFISYEVQAAVPGRNQAAEIAQAVAQAEARQKQAPASLYLGMTRAEIAATRNWPHPPPSPAIAPVGKPNAAKPVRLNGTASAGAAGLPQCGIASYAWKTDDGATGTAATLSHYFGPGRHTATLTVANNCGGAKSVETTFNVASGLKLGKVKLNRKAGTAKLQLQALGAGKLTLSGKGVKNQAKQLKRAGKVSLTLKPTGKTLSTLRRSGKAKVRLKVALLPKGGKASRLSKAVTLKLLG
ncbi:MAG: PKD domain-containing protein [Solirubrobacterales bacterium]